MSDTPQSTESNEERGLELHANPLGPQHPLLKACPKPKDTKPSRNGTARKAKRRKHR